MSRENNDNTYSSAVPASLANDVEIHKLPPFLRVKDVRFYFGIDRFKLWKMLADPNSGIKGSKVGKIWLIRTASILRLLKRTSHQVEVNNESN